jgi:putative endonuclease
MNFIVYILFSHTLKRFYAGQTDNLTLRLQRHNIGLVKTTKPGIPWIVIWNNSVESRSDALKLEKRIKKRGISRYMDDIKYDWRKSLEV